jgi:hypothetical protein
LKIKVIGIYNNLAKFLILLLGISWTLFLKMKNKPSETGVKSLVNNIVIRSGRTLDNLVTRGA